jgi:putative endonuclease
MYKKRLGKLGEDLAKNYLQTQGFEIKKSNFHVRGGEIDIIAKKGSTWHFIEVKTRTSKAFGELIEQISERQLVKITQAAELYLQQNQLVDPEWQIDVVTVYYQKPKSDVKYFPNVLQYW